MLCVRCTIRFCTRVGICFCTIDEVVFVVFVVFVVRFLETVGDRRLRGTEKRSRSVKRDYSHLHLTSGFESPLTPSAESGGCSAHRFGFVLLLLIPDPRPSTSSLPPSLHTAATPLRA
jgi:hypothetical protein